MIYSLLDTTDEFKIWSQIFKYVTEDVKLVMWKIFGDFLQEYGRHPMFCSLVHYNEQFILC
jgi:hypothetical protein